MPTFYIPDFDGYLSDEASHHAVRVLRLRVGDALAITDGAGTWLEGHLASTDPKRSAVSVSRRTELPARPYNIHLVMAPPKSQDRLEWFVEKATEIGTDRFTFVRCERSERRRINAERLTRVAVSALKQSGQAWLPALTPELSPLSAFLSDPARRSEASFVAHLEADRTPLVRCAKPGGRYCVLIGPEGGFTPTEIEQARTAGFAPVSLGHSTLRTETAGLVACHTLHLIQEAKPS